MRWGRCSLPISDDPVGAAASAGIDKAPLGIYCFSGFRVGWRLRPLHRHRHWHRHSTGWVGYVDDHRLLRWVVMEGALMTGVRVSYLRL